MRPAMRNNVGLFLAKRALLSPNLEGFVDADTGRRFTYAEWNARANRTANALLGLGVRKGDRVALLQMNSIEYMESFFAVAKLGAICVPLNWRLTPEELAFILRDSGSTTLVFGGEFTEAVNQLQARGRGEGGTELERFVYCGKPEARPAWALDYDALQASASDAEPHRVACDMSTAVAAVPSSTSTTPIHPRRPTWK